MTNKSSVDHGVDRYHQMDQSANQSSQLKTIYADWADTYDHDNDHKHGTVSQPNTVSMLARYMPNKHAEILDVGCGTGLVGLHLQHHQYHAFDGTDLSDEMLEVAKRRGYRNLFSANADEGLPVKSNYYDAVICVGVFTHGHLGPEGFEELVRVVKLGGLIAFTVNEGVYQKEGFDKEIQQYAENEVWEILEQEKREYMRLEDVMAWYVLARKQ